MSLSDIDRLCEFYHLSSRPPGYRVTLLGGEPTLHPELLSIIDRVRAHNPTVEIALLTNLTCEPGLVQQLVARRVGLLVNIVPREINSPEQQRAIDRNLDLLRHVTGLLFGLSVTIVSSSDDFGYVHDCLRADNGTHVWGLRIGLSCPGVDFGNDFIRSFSQRYGRRYAELVTTCHRINPRLDFVNECAVNLCLLSEGVYRRLSRIVGRLNLVCGEPNLDILPDFSTQWCYALRGVPALRIDNIFDYADSEAVGAELMGRMSGFLTGLRPHCAHRHCKEILCKGPCPAYSLFLSRTEV